MFFCFLQLKNDEVTKPALVVLGLSCDQKSHPCLRRDDILLRNGLPALVRCTFSKFKPDAHVWPLQIVALVAVAWTILHVPKLASQKCARRGRKTYIFKKELMSSTSKIFTFIFWGAKSACGATPVPLFRPPLPAARLIVARAPSRPWPSRSSLTQASGSSSLS